MRDRGGGRARRHWDRSSPKRETDRVRVPEPAGEGRLDRVRDRDRIYQLAARLQTTERDHPAWDHTFREHVNVTDKQLARRAATDIDARGQQDYLPPRQATRWQSKEAMVVVAIPGFLVCPDA